MNSQMLQKSSVFQIIRRKRCVLGWAPSLARLMFSGTRQMFGLQVSTQPQLKIKRGQTGTEATCPAEAREGGRTPGARGSRCAALPGALSSPLGEVCPLDTEQR